MHLPELVYYLVMETFKGFLYLILIAFLTVVLSIFVAWYFALALSIFFVIVLPPFIPMLTSKGKFETELDDTREIPSIILRDKKNELNDWELQFITDMEKKFKKDKFVDYISDKQLIKLSEIYVERVLGFTKEEVRRKDWTLNFNGREVKF